MSFLGVDNAKSAFFVYLFRSTSCALGHKRLLSISLALVRSVTDFCPLPGELVLGSVTDEKPGNGKKQQLDVRKGEAMHAQREADIERGWL